MKVLHINTLGFGGAATACIRLHQGLLKLGVESDLLMLNRGASSVERSHQFVKPPLAGRKKLLNKATRVFKELGLSGKSAEARREDLLRNRPQGYEAFSFPDTAFNLTEHPLYKQADVVNLHWVAGFVDYTSFFCGGNKKHVWTLHDMNPFTGGCHYSEGCEKFMSSCNMCPQLANTIDPDHSSGLLEVKKHSILKMKDLLKVVSPSRWLLGLSKSSRLFGALEHLHIPYGLNGDVFKPLAKKASREQLGLPQDKTIILFVSEHLFNRRKGIHLLLQALEKLGRKENAMLCTVGKAVVDNVVAGNYRHLGPVSDERLMAAVYSAADVFVIPSTEDNLPNTVLESLMCGTPVIGFPSGGIPEMVSDGENGYLCSHIGSEDLAIQLLRFIDQPERFDRTEISKMAAAKYGLEIQAKAYLSLYNDLQGIK